MGSDFARFPSDCGDDPSPTQLGIPELTLGLAAARRFSLAGALLLLLAIAPATPAVTGESASPYRTIGHGRMSIDTNLRSASHISAWSIDEYLARNTPLRGLGHAFKTAEAKYDVNALYLLAHAMHETGFGTSFIAQRYHNLFGWNAFDRDPSGLASRFPTYAAGIDYVASQIALYYLSPTGKFYGGAATLRGMHYYASDPQWAVLIARIANGIVLPTLAGRDITFGAPGAGDATAGKPLTVTVTTTSGSLPDGLEAAYRFVPIAVVEAGTPSGMVPPADPDFRLAKGESENDQLRISVTAPTRPGRYRLELELRDSDGTALTEFDVPEIPSAPVRVYGADAVSYAIAATDTGFAVTITNEGTRTIPATASVSGASGATPTTVPTTLCAWLVGPDGTPALVGRAPFTGPLKAGASWTADIAAPDAALLPGILVVRVEVGGAPARLAGSPPGVFRLGSDGRVAQPDPAPTASASPDPSATAEPLPSPDPSMQAQAAASAPPVNLTVGDLTPIDAASRVLLNPDWKPGTPARPSGSKAAVTGTTKSGVVRLAYQPLVSPLTPGSAVIRITNHGTTALLASLADPAATAQTATPATEVDEAATDPTAVIQVTAVPAWGPATEPIVLAVPLLIDVDPGSSLDVGIALPAAPRGQSSYLVVARVIGSDGHQYPATVFWLRGAPAGTVPHAAVAAPALAATASHAPASHAPVSSAPVSNTPAPPASAAIPARPAAPATAATPNLVPAAVLPAISGPSTERPGGA
jgi:hypothetical protein